MTILGFALAALAAQAQALPAPDARIAWETIEQDPDGQILLDPGTIRRDGDFVHFTLRLISHRTGEDPFAFALMRVVIDCAHRTRGYEAGRSYDSDNRLLQTRDSSPGEIEMESFDADSPEHMYHRRLCPGAAT